MALTTEQIDQQRKQGDGSILAANVGSVVPVRY